MQFICTHRFISNAIFDCWVQYIAASCNRGGCHGRGIQIYRDNFISNLNTYKNIWAVFYGLGS